MERRTDGYHVTVIAKGSYWAPSPVNMSTAIPVASIREEYDPSLDWGAKWEKLSKLVSKLED